MRKQQQIWQQEHTTGKQIPGIATDIPSTGMFQFTEFLKGNGVKIKSKILDIGSGKGRNSIYLAQRDYMVYCIDYIESAINTIKFAAQQLRLSHKMNFTVGEIDSAWSFEDNFFDAAIDCYSSIDIETKEGREMYKKELFRTLKPQAYALIMVVSNEDPIEKELTLISPGPEQNSTIWPSGKFQKNYSEGELREFYKEFNIIDFQTIQKPAHKLERDYTAINYRMIIQKQ